MRIAIIAATSIFLGFSSRGAAFIIINSNKGSSWNSNACLFYYQNIVDGFRLQVAAGWMIENIDNIETIPHRKMKDNLVLGNKL